MSWITDRIKERSTHNGVIVAAAAVAVIWGGMALLDIVVWAGLFLGLSGTLLIKTTRKLEKL